MEQMINPEQIIFGLDIGTRSIVGTVGYKTMNTAFTVMAQYSKEHETRAMMDGQIHDILKVSESIKQVKEHLEKELQFPLSKVCIAAAGRILKTTQIHSEMTFQTECEVTEDHLHSLEMLAIEKSYSAIREDTKRDKSNFYHIGSSCLKYYLNGYEMQNLIGHKAERIGMDLLSTFLPEEVIEGLYTAVEKAGLEVSNLTLEPIAAISVAIPEKYRLLNIAMVDVGAGTSDLCITKDGAIIAYGMIPFAGDEITETIQKAFLVDFATAEKLKINCFKDKPIPYKDAFMVARKADPKQVREAIAPTITNITNSITDKIIELNGKPVSAVFIVGGGGRIPGFCENIAKNMGLPEDRVAIRGADVLKNIQFLSKGMKKDSLIITPIGICVSYYERQNQFIYINVNNDRVKLYDTGKLTIVDAAIMAGFPNECLFPRRGANLTYKVNGEEKILRGETGEPAVIKKNNEVVSMNESIQHNDSIEIMSATKGETAKITLDKIVNNFEKLTFYIEDDEFSFDRICYINQKPAKGNIEIQDKDEIEILDYYTLEQLLLAMHIGEQHLYTVNGEDAELSRKLYQDDHIAIRQKPVKAPAQVMYHAIADIPVREQSQPENYEIYKQASNKENQNTDNIEQSKVTVESKPELRSDVKSEPSNTVQAVSDTIYITVNREVVKLQNKKSYIVVDILDFYPFDITKGGTKTLIISVNGKTADFTTSIKDSDHVEIYWS